ncbi:MAG: hypothetical protein QOJ40_309, partial [Verrucomicrobiota bacterium]
TEGELSHAIEQLRSFSLRMGLPSNLSFKLFDFRRFNAQGIRQIH